MLDERGEVLAPEQEGAICIRLPLPPGTLPTLWRDDERYIASYLSTYDGYYLTGDGGHVDEDGYLYVMGRTDDVINVAGHRLSTGGMEEALASHPAVAECAVIGVADTFKGQVPRGFVVLKAGVDRPEEELRAELVAIVRERIGALSNRLLTKSAIVAGPMLVPPRRLTRFSASPGRLAGSKLRLRGFSLGTARLRRLMYW